MNDLLNYLVEGREIGGERRHYATSSAANAWEVGRAIAAGEIPELERLAIDLAWQGRGALFNVAGDNNVGKRTKATVTVKWTNGHARVTSVLVQSGSNVPRRPRRLEAERRELELRAAAPKRPGAVDAKAIDGLPLFDADRSPLLI